MTMQSAESPDCPNDCPLLKVQRWVKGEWKEKDISIQELSSPTANAWAPLIGGDNKLWIITVAVEKVAKCQPCQQVLIDNFGMPSVWWSDHHQNSPGYFGCDDVTVHGRDGFNTWAFFEIKQVVPEEKASQKKVDGSDPKSKPIGYFWQKVNVFTRWLPEQRRNIVLLFNHHSPKNEQNGDTYTPKDRQKEAKEQGRQLTHVLKATLGPLTSNDEKRLEDPFWVYTRIAADVARLEEDSVWGIRDYVRGIEKEEKNTDDVPNYRRLHDIQRHATHVTETLEIATQNLQGIRKQHAEVDLAPNENDDRVLTDLAKVKMGVQRSIEASERLVGSLKHRSISNEKRLNNEIQLAYNLVAQRDASNSVDIAKASKEDSVAMRTISLITLFFLPPTFVSTIFGMGFFDLGGESGRQLIVGDSFWLYWVVAIPMTFIAGLWYSQLGPGSEDSWSRKKVSSWMGEKGKDGDIRMATFSSRFSHSA